MEKIQIRNVRLSDAKALAEINVLCWQKNYRGIITDSFLDKMSITPKRIERFKDQINEKEFYFCAVQNGQVVGYLNAKKGTNKKNQSPL